MLNTPFAPWPAFTRAEADAVADLLLSNRVNYWTGDECRRFEQEFAVWAGAAHAVAVANGTLALDLALMALEIGPGAEVVVTPRTFFASAGCIVNAGAVPVFADVDRDSQNISAASIEAVLTPRTRAIVCVHLAGWPCEMDAISQLARRHGLAVIEDCAQAHGARYKGRAVGTLGDVAAWSFCQDKIISTGGEGGMVTTNDASLSSRIWSLKDHGKSWDAVYRRKHPTGFRWLHESFGTNARLTEIQAAIGRIQLARMPEWHRLRKRNAGRILDACENLPGLRVARPPAHIDHAWYKCYVFLRPERLKPEWSRTRILDWLNERGVPCFSGSCPEVYLEKAFDGSPARPARRLENAKELGETSLMFMVHPTLSEADIARTCAGIAEVMELASG